MASFSKQMIVLAGAATVAFTVSTLYPTDNAAASNDMDAAAAAQPEGDKVTDPVFVLGCR